MNKTLFMKMRNKKQKLMESRDAWSSQSNPGQDTFNGCIMLELESADVQKLRKEIKKSDLTSELSNNAHVTLLYGIASNVHPVSELRRFTNNLQYPKTITLAGPVLFENGREDVIVLEIVGSELSTLSSANLVLRHGLVYENAYQFYKPHVTIANVKPGKGAEYIKKMGFKTFTVESTSITYSVDGSTITDSNTILK